MKNTVNKGDNKNCNHSYDEYDVCFECDARRPTPSQQCKAGGLKNLKQLSQLSETSVQTLDNWSRYKPALFELVLLGAISKTNAAHKNIPLAADAQVY